MKPAVEILVVVVLFLLSQLSEVRADGFALLESYPQHGQVVTVADLLHTPIYLKFNNPIDRSYIGVVKILDTSAPSICQLNICESSGLKRMTRS